MLEQGKYIMGTIKEISTHFADKIKSKNTYGVDFSFTEDFEFPYVNEENVIRDNELENVYRNAVGYHGIKDCNSLLKEFDSENWDLLLIGNYYGGGKIEALAIPSFYDNVNSGYSGFSKEELLDSIMNLIVKLLFFTDSDVNKYEDVPLIVENNMF